MYKRFASTAAFSLALAASVAVFGAVSAFAQTTNTGYDMLNAQSATPSAGVSGYTSPSATGTMNSNSTVNGTNATTNATGTSGTTSGTMNSTNATTPGVPNTGAGGDAPINLAVLILSGLVVAAGMTYVTLRLAL